MRAQRRLRLYVIVVVAVLIALAYFTTDSGGGIQNHHFYKNTVTAMNNAHAASIKKTNDAKDRSHIQKLDFENNNNNARKQSTLNNDIKQEKTTVGDSKKIEDNYDDLDGIPVAGRTKMSIPKPKQDQVLISGDETGASDPIESASVVEHGHEHEKVQEKEGPSQEEIEEQEASEELDSILKRSPIIVFSKSYCPFSKKAKHILSQYSIVPAPYIVELDQHPLGPQIQKLVGKITGRRTVPNVMVNGLSIGGGDDIEALDMENMLISKIKSIAGKKVMEVNRLPTAE